VHRDRALVAGVADHRQHLPDAQALAAGDQLGQQQLADALAARGGIQVDRVLDAEAVGAARPELVGVGVAQYPAAAFGHQPGQALGQDRVAALAHLGVVGFVQLEGAGAVAYGLAVDRGAGGDVGGRAVAQQQGGRVVNIHGDQFIMLGFRRWLVPCRELAD